MNIYYKVNFDCLPLWLKPYIIRIDRSKYILSKEEFYKICAVLYNQYTTDLIGELVVSLEKNLKNWEEASILYSAIDS